MWPFHKREDLFRSVPGPSPWYTVGPLPGLPNYTWITAGQGKSLSGKTILVGPAGPVLITSFSYYTQVMEESQLLIWNQASSDTNVSAPVVLTMLELAQLAPLEGSIPDLCTVMDSEQATLSYNSVPSFILNLDTTVIEQPLHYAFPQPLNHLDELLILCRSSAIDSGRGWQLTSLALLVAQPTHSRYELFPQDWFNNGSFDFMYEWVTRVVRHPHTRRIHGEGIRMRSFILNDTLRQLR